MNSLELILEGKDLVADVHLKRQSRYLVLQRRHEPARSIRRCSMPIHGD